MTDYFYLKRQNDLISVENQLKEAENNLLV